MTTQKISYGTRSPVTCTIASLANNANRQSVLVDNTSALATDYAISVKITTGTSPTLGFSVAIFIAPGDATYLAGGASGSDAAYSAGGENVLQLCAAFSSSGASNQTQTAYVPSLAGLFGGACPPKFSFVVENTTQAALNATAGNHEIAVTPITYTNS